MDTVQSIFWGDMVELPIIASTRVNNIKIYRIYSTLASPKKRKRKKKNKSIVSLIINKYTQPMSCCNK